MVGLHDEIDHKKCIEDWRPYSIKTISCRIFENDEVHMQETDENHESFPNLASLNMVYFFIEVRLLWVYDVETRLFTPESIFDMFGSHIESFQLIELFDKISSVGDEIVG